MDFAAQLAAADRVTQDHLGDEVTYTPGVGAAVSVRGPFDTAYQLANAGESGISSSGPAVFLLLADLPSDPETDVDATVTVDGVTYRPVAVEPDGKGGVLLRLHEVV